ncbi:MAG: bifunctional glutamate--cysteine ligase GshA/glutathione synthetase GshB [Bacilli bacterium]
MEYTSLKCLNKSVIKSFLSKIDKDIILDNQYAMEREMLRVIGSNNSSYLHPEVFGLKTNNAYITTDFAENQVEIVTPIFDTLQRTVNFSEALYDIVANELHVDESLWPLSMPCIINNDVPIACFPESDNYEEYRNYLSNKYGNNVQMISGIHFNFSFGENFLKTLYSVIDCKKTFKDFKDTVYLKVINNYNYYRYLITVFLSASPKCHESFGNVDNVFALRSSKFGYCNNEEINIDYSSLDSFIESVNIEMKNKKIIDEREIYDSIRIKNGNKFVTQNVLETGIKYIEIRNIDINPYEKIGVNIDDLKFVELILVYCLLSDLRKEDIFREVSNCNDINKYKERIITDMNLLLKFNNENDLGLEDIINNKITEIQENKLLTNRITNDLKNCNFLDFGKSYAKKYLQSAYKNRFKFVGLSHIELSTQLLIKSAVKRGVNVKFLDEEDNFIELSNGNITEIVKQCTQTNLDGFANVLAMSNKVVTKKILANNSMKVPKGKDFISKSDALKYAMLLKRNFVIKPKSTNFGIGISIFKNNVIYEDVKDAIELAFLHDSSIIIEEFITGKEYRFLVIDAEVAGVLNRVPANVIGDGEKSIKELVETKNQDCLRGVGYVSPLEKINIDEPAKLFLNSQGLSEDSILNFKQQIFLRENSNISTGGDSIDYTNEVDDFFKEIAINAAKTFDICFCGVDIIIEDINDCNSNYAIIEVNFNPAIHIHSFPYSGEEREIASYILKALKLVNI